MALQPTDQRGVLSPSERLHALARAAYPKNDVLRALEVEQSVQKTWQDLTAATGRDAWKLAEKIGSLLHVPVAPNLSIADTKLAGTIPEQLARQVLILPLRDEGGELSVACACPFEGGGLRRVRFVTDRKLKLHIAPAKDIEQAIGNLYSRAAENQSRVVGSLLFSSDAQSEAKPKTQEDESALVRLAQGLVIKAVEAGASDMHIQPFANGGMVRIRVDGVLRRLAYLPGAVVPSLVRYFKANGGMDPTNDRAPQDGRVSAVINEHDYDVRLSVLPASHGERLVMRFLDQSKVYRLSGTSFSIAEIQTFRRMATSNAGVLLLTGPTGSGKTSTLYSIISELNRVGVSIITVENPVEYRVTGISQVEVNPKAGLTFASALRSILRQDPDVILIGEIRDAETAQIAMQAALTGHLVLSTLHTNDALTAIPRLTDLGVDPSILGEALVGVVAQRLLRKLCQKCRVPPSDPYRPEEFLFRKVTGEWPAYRSVGCEACDHSGFAGRIPVTEIVEMTPELANAIAHGDGSVSSLREIERGKLASIAVTAAKRVISGGTSVLEAVRVIGPRFWLGTAQGFNRPLPSETMLANIIENEQHEGPQVLVFHRNPEMATAMAAALRVENFTPLVANSPEEARPLLEKNENTVLLIGDLTPAPGETALELLKKLRVALAWSQLPPLVIVPAGDTQSSHALESHGVNDYLVHPVTPEHIAARARVLIKG